MKMERSDTWAGNGQPVWRIQAKHHWGPWCYSRRDAIWQWIKNWHRPNDWGPGLSITMLVCVLGIIIWETARKPFVRGWRWFAYKCVVCGRNCSNIPPARCHYRYCSIECCAYDDALKDPKKSWVLFGTVHDHPKPHYEAAMNEE